MPRWTSAGPRGLRERLRRCNARLVYYVPQSKQATTPSRQTSPSPAAGLRGRRGLIAALVVRDSRPLVVPRDGSRGRGKGSPSRKLTFGCHGRHFRRFCCGRTSSGCGYRLRRTSLLMLRIIVAGTGTRKNTTARRFEIQESKKRGTQRPMPTSYLSFCFFAKGVCWSGWALGGGFAQEGSTGVVWRGRSPHR